MAQDRAAERRVLGDPTTGGIGVAVAHDPPPLLELAILDVDNVPDLHDSPVAGQTAPRLGRWLDGYHLEHHGPGLHGDGYDVADAAPEQRPAQWSARREAIHTLFAFVHYCEYMLGNAGFRLRVHAVESRPARCANPDLAANCDCLFVLSDHPVDSVTANLVEAKGFALGHRWASLAQRE